MLNNVSQIVESGDCTACSSCLHSCPEKAISFRVDRFGFDYPEIDSKKCVNCGLCLKKCHVETKMSQKSVYPKKAYIAYAKNRKTSRLSASGGGFISVSSAFIEKTGGVVFGCEMNEGLLVLHSYAEQVFELKKFQCSKYVQSDLNDCYARAREFLRNGRKVLFSGLPCQIAGLRAFLGDSGGADNLYTVELICHGVPSRIGFENYCRYIEKKYSGKLMGFRFRNKNLVHRSGFVMQYLLDDRKIEIVSGNEPFFSLYGKGLLHRESCYRCRYAKRERVADITLGDCASRTMTRGPFPYEPVSTVLVNSGKGAELFSYAGDKMKTTEMNYEKEAATNKQLSAPSERPADRDKVALAMAEGRVGELVAQYPCNAKKALPIPYKLKVFLYRITGKYKKQI